MTTETLTAPVETVTPIKPSEAIRLGCLIAPVQRFEWYGDGVEACALGAMSLGYGSEEACDPDDFMPKALLDGMSGLPCPACGREDRHAIVHLNDDHRWSRERIADWLAEQGL